VNHLNLGKYSEMIATSKLRDDLDSAFTNYNPKTSRIFVEIPTMSSTYLDPVSQLNSSYNLDEET
jgi:hypothetical protein